MQEGETVAINKYNVACEIDGLVFEILLKF